MSNTILVTGATGFVGAHLVRQLLAEGHPVRIFRRERSNLDYLGEASTAVEHVLGDIRNPDAVLGAVQGASRVYHCAAYIGVGQRSDRKRLHSINVLGTRHVVDACLAAGVERLVSTSSIAALGRPANPEDCISESASWSHSRFNTAYGRSKYDAELEVSRGVAEGLQAVMVNPSLIFGVGKKGENTWQIVDAIHRGKLPVIPSGSTSVVDVEDVATGHRLAMKHGASGERYILGGENLTWKQLVETLATAMSVPAPRFSPRPGVLMAAATVVEGWSLITRSRPLLTRESVRITSSQTCYNSEKARKELEWGPRPFASTAKRIAEQISGLKT